jgi:hypothetical protein
MLVESVVFSLEPLIFHCCPSNCRRVSPGRRSEHSRIFAANARSPGLLKQFDDSSLLLNADRIEDQLDPVVLEPFQLDGAVIVRNPDMSELRSVWANRDTSHRPIAS